VPDGQLLYYPLSDWLSQYQHAIRGREIASSGCGNNMGGRWVHLEFSVGDHVVMLVVWAEVGADGVPFPVAARFEGTRDEVWEQVNAWRRAMGPGW